MYNNDFMNFIINNRYDKFMSFKLVRDIGIILVLPLPYYEKPIWIQEYIGGSPIPTDAMYLLSDFILGNS